MAFQRAKGLSVSGKVDAATAAALGLAAGRRPGAGAAGRRSPSRPSRCRARATTATPGSAARGNGRVHLGVDILAAEGNQLYAVATGTIIQIYADAPGSLSGNGLKIPVPTGRTSSTPTCRRWRPGIAVGTAVTAGQLVGYVGHTGNAGGPHLHLEVHPGGGSAVNPYRSSRRWAPAEPLRRDRRSGLRRGPPATAGPPPPRDQFRHDDLIAGARVAGDPSRPRLLDSARMSAIDPAVPRRAGRQPAATAGRPRGPGARVAAGTHLPRRAARRRGRGHRRRRRQGRGDRPAQRHRRRVPSGLVPPRLPRAARRRRRHRQHRGQLRLRLDGAHDAAEAVGRRSVAPRPATSRSTTSATSPR